VYAVQRQVFLTKTLLQLGTSGIRAASDAPRTVFYEATTQMRRIFLKEIDLTHGRYFLIFIVNKD